MMPSVYSVFLLKSLEKMLHLALRYDPGTQQHLLTLEGKRLFVEIHQPEISVMVTIQGGTIFLHADHTESAHATVESRSLDLLREFFRSQPVWVNGPVRIAGQMELVQELYDLLHHIDIDWEAPLSQLIGDQGAHQLGRSLRQLARFTRNSARIMFQNSREYLQEELGEVPMRWEQDEFFQDIQDLRSDTDRLTDRLARLEQRLNTPDHP